MVPGGGDLVAQVRQIKNLLNVSQTIGPLDKCLAGDGPVGAAVAALLARLVEKISRLPSTRAGLIARLPLLVLLVRRWLLPGRGLLRRVGGGLTFSLALALASRVLSGRLALSLALALALSLPLLGRRIWFLASGSALRLSILRLSDFLRGSPGSLPLLVPRLVLRTLLRRALLCLLASGLLVLWIAGLSVWILRGIIVRFATRRGGLRILWLTVARLIRLRLTGL